MTAPDNWSEVQLGDLVNEESPICYGILMPGESVEGGVPVLKVRDMTGSKIITANLMRTAKEIDDQFKRSKLKVGDLVLSIRGTTGRVGIVPVELDNGNITQDTARIRLNNRADRGFVFQYLQSAYVQTQIQHHTIGQAVKGINLSEVRKLHFYLPSIDRFHLKCTTQFHQDVPGNFM